MRSQVIFCTHFYRALCFPLCLDSSDKGCECWVIRELSKIRHLRMGIIGGSREVCLYRAWWLLAAPLVSSCTYKVTVSLQNLAISGFLADQRIWDYEKLWNWTHKKGMQCAIWHLTATVPAVLLLLWWIQWRSAPYLEMFLAFISIILWVTDGSSGSQEILFIFF